MGFNFNADFFLTVLFSPVATPLDVYLLFGEPYPPGSLLPTNAFFPPVFATVSFALFFGPLLFIGPKIRKYWVITTGCVALSVFLSLGELRSQNLMCQSARELGVSQFDRLTFLQTIKQAERLSKQRHAAFLKDGDRYGWSYYALSFEELDSKKRVNSGSSVECVQRTGPLRYLAQYRAEPR